MKIQKQKLSSVLGQLFAFCVYTFHLFCSALIILSIVERNFNDLIAGIVFLVFGYLVFGRKTFRTKTIEFDTTHFYIKDGSKISFKDIAAIRNGRIDFIENGIEKRIDINPYYPGEHHKLFEKLFINAKKGV